MSIKVLRPRSAEGVLTIFNKLAANGHRFIYRGHTKKHYRLQSTLQRAHGITIEEGWNDGYLEMLQKFQNGLAKIGQLPADVTTHFDLLEYARHYGLPSPCIDFSYSPYVALFFALSGLERSDMYGEGKNPYSVIYALDKAELALGWARFKAKKIMLDIDENTSAGQEIRRNLFNDFLTPYADGKRDIAIFDEGFPPNVLQFIPFPANFNKRMQRQCGCFLYDTISYRYYGWQDLEGFIESIEEPITQLPNGSSEPKNPTLYKILIPKKSAAKDLLKQLELMGIMGMYLYDSPEGVAQDVAATYFYNSITLYSRDQFKNSNK